MRFKRAAIAATLGLFCALSAAVAPAQNAPEFSEQAKNAVGTLKSINTAQAYYQSHYSAVGYACNLANLSFGEGTAAPSAANAGLLDNALASGMPRMGYRFKLECSSRTAPQKNYRLSAEPANHSGPALCSDETGVIRMAEEGGEHACFSHGKAVK